MFYDAGGLAARVGKMNAIARAGSEVTVAWSGMIKMHHGPVMSVRWSVRF
jgi:hypothetical protein